jgi:hypothetical protein
MDEERKRELKRSLRAHEQMMAQEAMLLDDESLNRLLDYLDVQLADSPCDHTLRLTRTWAAQGGINQDALAASVEHFGGYCDCEVLANVDPEAIF